VVSEEGSEASFQVRQVAVKTTKPIDDREKITTDNPLDHGKLRGSLKGTAVNSLQGSLFIDGEGFHQASEIPLERQPDVSELFGSPCHDPLDQWCVRWLVM
jgi:hypothetical protein